ncbi:TNF receptor-associated factor 3-like [Hydractinia symbiolongicarpus]|uniref:TNF receptor-associated factor 3-like n=1 Tax=Hydractinia symbiolongicarpus TaxID=13093 RepID=UPI00254EDB03|nr:TNF receptor-associated factor 3-like [Hydractinia symbiolongicarpus]
MDSSKGYNIQTLIQVPVRLICALCGLILRNTIQTSRGERACSTCYNEAVRKPGLCPIDGEEPTEIFKDKYADKEIGEIECYCTNKSNNCNWIGPIKLLEQHFEECEFNVVPCSKCNEDVLRRDLATHERQLCVKRTIHCPYCGITLSHDLYQEHEPICPDRPKMCPMNCGKGLTDGHQNHLLECSNIRNGQACVYQLLGCNYKGGQSVLDHKNETHLLHDVVTVTSISQLQHDNFTLQKAVQESSDKIAVLEERHLLDQQAIMHQREEVNSLKNDVKKLQKKYEEQMLLVLEKVNNLDRKVNEHENPTSEGITQALKECNEKVERLDNSQTMLSSNLSDLDLRQQLLENTCYNGRMLWKIDNLEYRMKQAVDGKVTALHSAPCFTKKFGYKFCTRLYLNGDGIGRDSHVSLFFVLMRSEYDALLEWPFREKVTFRLLSANDVRGLDIRETFLPDRTSTSFQKPVREMNVAAGCPTFITIDELKSGKYIIGNSIFIETVVG